MEVQMPHPDEDRDPNAKTWTCKTGIGNDAAHNILHLENQMLYCWMGVRSSQECEEYVKALQGDHPLRGLPPADMPHVNAIQSMSFSQTVKTLEIDHGDPVPFTIRGTEICADVFNSIRESISREYTVTQGTVSLSSAIQAPLACLTLVVLVGGAISFSLWVGNNVKESHKHLSIAVTVGLSLLMLGLLGFRAFVRPQAEILRVVEE
jgi:hypothetical protein